MAYFQYLRHEPNKIMRSWRLAVSDYSTLDLTFAGDALPVLFGFEHAFSKLLDNECGNEEEERDGCCIEGATASDYLHNRAE